jgi:hopanoid-associated phosphorylase
LSYNGQSVLAVTGLATEARIAAGPGIDVVCSGCDPGRLRALLATLAPTRYSAIVSFGISGALDPALRPGDTIVATDITSDSGSWQVPSHLARALCDRLTAIGTSVSRGTLAGVNAPVIEAAGKARLRQATGAAAVDMESHVVASFGAAAGVPACAVRVISDPADRSLPALAMRAVKPDGRVDLAAVLARMAGNPGQIPLLIRTGRDARIAFAALRRVRSLLQLGLGLSGANLR